MYPLAIMQTHLKIRLKTLEQVSIGVLAKFYFVVIRHSNEYNKV